MTLICDGITIARWPGLAWFFYKYTADICRDECLSKAALIILIILKTSYYMSYIRPFLNHRKAEVEDE